MGRETKDFTIYVDVDAEPDACARCGSADPMLSQTVPFPDTEPRSVGRYVELREPCNPVTCVRYVNVPELHHHEEQAWVCSACRHVHLYPDDDGERVVTLPVKLEVCSRCEGHGTHLTPSIGEHAYTWEEFHESFDDEEAEEYFRRGGMYDVTCHRCKGENVEHVIDYAACERDPKLAADLALCARFWEQEADDRAEQEAERRMGA